MRKAILALLFVLLATVTVWSGDLKKSGNELTKSVGSLYVSTDEGLRHKCSCFAIKNTQYLMTAAHCVNDGPLSVWFAPRPGALAQQDSIYVPVETIVDMSGEGVDIAVLRWPGAKFKQGFELADREPEAGETVFAIGYPSMGGGSLTLTKGMASFTRGDKLQSIDINGGPGNSGGPFFDTKGKVIGVFVSVRYANFGGFISHSPRLESLKKALKALQ